MRNELHFVDIAGENMVFEFVETAWEWKGKDTFYSDTEIINVRNKIIIYALYSNEN